MLARVTVPVRMETVAGLVNVCFGSKKKIVFFAFCSCAFEFREYFRLVGFSCISCCIFMEVYHFVDTEP